MYECRLISAEVFFIKENELPAEPSKCKSESMPRNSSQWLNLMVIYICKLLTKKELDWLPFPGTTTDGLPIIHAMVGHSDTTTTATSLLRHNNHCQPAPPQAVTETRYPNGILPGITDEKTPVRRLGASFYPVSDISVRICMVRPSAFSRCF